MRLIPVLLPLLSRLATAEVLGSWTVSSFARQCNPQDTACTYTLTLTTSYLANQDHVRDDDTTTCSFPVLSKSASNTPSAKKASRTDFSHMYCSGGDHRDRYLLNGGWETDVDVPGEEFLTLVVTDVAWDTYAFFGFREGELTAASVSGGVKRENAYRVGTFASSSSSSSTALSSMKGEGERAATGGNGMVKSWVEKMAVKLGSAMGRMGFGNAKQEEGMMEDKNVKRNSEEDQKEWQIKGLTRAPDTTANTTNWDFSILDVGTGQETHCNFTAPNADLTASMYGWPCGTDANANWGISWGYNSAADSAVMTVCYAPNGTDAWFGYEQVSHIQQLGDSQKELVYFTGCA